MPPVQGIYWGIIVLVVIGVLIVALTRN